MDLSKATDQELMEHAKRTFQANRMMGSLTHLDVDFTVRGHKRKHIGYVPNQQVWQTETEREHGPIQIQNIVVTPVTVDFVFEQYKSIRSSQQNKGV